MIGMKPKDDVKLKEVPLVENYPPEDTLPEDGLYHYLLQPNEEPRRAEKGLKSHQINHADISITGCLLLWNPGFEKHF